MNSFLLGIVTGWLFLAGIYCFYLIFVDDSDTKVAHELANRAKETQKKQYITHGELWAPLLTKARQKQLNKEIQASIGACDVIKPKKKRKYRK